MLLEILQCLTAGLLAVIFTAAIFLECCFDFQPGLHRLHHTGQRMVVRNVPTQDPGISFTTVPKLWILKIQMASCWMRHVSIVGWTAMVQVAVTLRAQEESGLLELQGLP